MTLTMTNDELTRAWAAAEYASSWYDGNNPGKQRRLTKEASELAGQMHERGLETRELARQIGADPSFYWEWRKQHAGDDARPNSGVQEAPR